MTATATEPVVRYAVEDGFATVTLDSPANRNALSARMEADLGEALTDAVEDGCRAVVLTHTGGVFCAGTDVGDGKFDAETATARTTGLIALLRHMVELPLPVIGKVDGHVRGAGVGLVAACDIAVAGPASTFSLGEVRLGLAPYAVALALLPRLAPRAAARFSLTGERFDNATAEAIGLVTTATDDVDGAVGEICAGLALASPQGLAESKWLVTRTVVDGFDRYEAEAIRRSVKTAASDEVAEGMASFLEKRPPRWALELKGGRDGGR